MLLTATTQLSYNGFVKDLYSLTDGGGQRRESVDAPIGVQQTPVYYTLFIEYDKLTGRNKIMTDMPKLAFISAKLTRHSGVTAKNKSGRRPEHTEALREDAARQLALDFKEENVGTSEEEIQTT